MTVIANMVVVTLWYCEVEILVAVVALVVIMTLMVIAALIDVMRSALRE